jgi:hypothetical protein
MTDDQTTESWSAVARDVLGRPEPREQPAVRMAAGRALERVGGPVGLLAAAAPTVAFVVADAVSGLQTALVALAVTAVLACVMRLVRRESPGAAIAGLVVAGFCAAVAAFMGEARAFFLPTTFVPPLFVLAYVVSLALGRPLLGLIVNPLAGGPRTWREHPVLRRVYLISTLIALFLASLNLVLRIAFYVADAPAVLAAIQVGSNIVFATHFAVTLVVARRVVVRERGPGVAAVFTPGA